jgi:hypothetical protein
MYIGQCTKNILIMTYILGFFCEYNIFCKKVSCCDFFVFANEIIFINTIKIKKHNGAWIGLTILNRKSRRVVQTNWVNYSYIYLPLNSK